MNNDNMISHSLLLSVEPLDINKLHLNDDNGQDKFDWQADKTECDSTSIFARLMSLFKL